MGDENKLGRRAFLAAAASGTAACMEPTRPGPIPDNSRDDGTPVSTPESATTQTDTTEQGVRVIDQDVLSRSNVETVLNWQNNKIDNLDWSDVKERREELYDDVSTAREDFTDEDIRRLPLEEDDADDYEDGVMFFRDNSGNDRGFLIFADEDEWGNVFEDSYPEAVWPAGSAAERRSDEFETPEESGDIDSDYDDFLAEAGLPLDFEDEYDNTAHEIMRTVVPYLGDMGERQGLQIFERFVDQLIGDAGDQDDGVLDLAETRMKELESDWIDYLNGGENNSVTRYMRRIAGNEEAERSEIKDIISILEDPSERQTEVVSQQVANQEGYITVGDESESLAGDLKETREEIIQEFLEDRQYGAFISLTARMLENARRDIRNKADNYFFRDPEDFDLDFEFEATYDDRRELREKIEDLEDDEGRRGLYDLFGRVVEEEREYRRELLPEDVWEDIEDFGDSIPLRELRDFYDGDYDRPHGDIIEIRFGGEVDDEFDEYDDPAEDAEFRLDYVEIDIRREEHRRDDDYDTITLVQEDDTAFFEDYVFRYFIDDELEVDYIRN